MSGLDFKLARIRQGRRQLEVARQTGIHPTRLSKIENGWEQPRDGEISVLRTVLMLDEQQGEPEQATSVA